MRDTQLLMVDLQASNLRSVGGVPRPYQPYGAHLPDGGALLGFTGQPADPVTGCYHLGNGRRTYNPLLRRFHSPDTISPFGDGGLNAYAYCLGDPVNHRDPTGQKAEDYVLPVLSILTNLASLFISGLRFRSLYKRTVVSRTADTGVANTPGATPIQPTTKELLMSSISATSAIAGLTLGVARTVEPGKEWQTWALASLTVVSLGTSVYEAWGLAQAKPWKVQTSPTLLNSRHISEQIRSN